ncbi:MAG: hypothetical protein HKN42_18325 [Granulosicoccus sp.]|nr:hypothetical protein [Granulosicoccus sp.]
MKTQISKICTAVLLAFGVLAGSGTAAADDGYLVFNTVALHFENADERNALTPGVGWEYSPSSKLGWHLGTLSDSFGYQAYYGGINYATAPRLAGRVRFLIGATLLHKQYKKNAEPETKLVPLPAMEVKLTNRSVLNLSGSPQVDYGNHRNNAVLFFQFKLKLQ